MAGKRSNLICSKCKNRGFLTKRPVKTRVQIPKEENIKTLSDAFDYAAKVCLCMHEDVIRFPPSLDDDKKFAESFYNEFNSRFSLHSADEIKSFESMHLSLLLKRNASGDTNKKDHKPWRKSKPLVDDKYYSDMERPNDLPIHIGLSKDTGRITKFCVAWLYAAIVYTTLRDLICEFQITEEDDKWFASGVYSFFSFLPTSDKRSIGPLQWSNILRDVKDHGFNAAASLNYAVSTYCRKCTNIRKKTYVEMEIVEANSGGKWYCGKCGGTEGIKTCITPKYIHSRVNEIEQRVKNVQNCYLPLMDHLAMEIRNDPDMRRLLQEYFNKYEIEARKLSFHKYMCYFMGHYDISKKFARKWCSLRKSDILKIEIDDSNYKDMIKKLLCSDEKIGNELFSLLRDKLEQWNWPNHLMFDKIIKDCETIHYGGLPYQHHINEFRY